MKLLLGITFLFVFLVGCSDDEQYTNTPVVALHPSANIVYEEGDSILLKINVVSMSAISQVNLTVVGDDIDSTIHEWKGTSALKFAVDSVLFTLHTQQKDSAVLKLNVEVLAEDGEINYPRSVLYLQEPDTLAVLDSFMIYHTKNSALDDAIDLSSLSSFKYQDGTMGAFIKDASLVVDSLDYAWTSLDEVDMGLSSVSFDDLTQKTIEEAYYSAAIVDTVKEIKVSSDIITHYESSGLLYYSMIHISGIEDTVATGVDQNYTVEVKQYIK